jgi:hypothetical protein
MSTDLVIADLDFTPCVECDCDYPVPHVARYVATSSCGCVSVICETAMWNAVLCTRNPSFCVACHERDVLVQHVRPI